MTPAYPRVLGVGTAVPPYRVTQEHAKSFARKMFSANGKKNVERLLRVFDNTGIEGRHLCVPFEWARPEHTFAYKNSLYVESAVELSAKAARRAIEEAGVSPDDVGTVVFGSTTGISTPSIDSKLVFELGLPHDVRRIPIWGIGCAAGAAGLGLAADLARARPNRLVLLVAIELCSYTYQRDDLSKANLISSAIFADGAGAVLLGLEGHGPEVLGGHSSTWPDTEDIMGWEIVEKGMKVRLSRSLSDFLEAALPGTLVEACDAYGLEPGDVAHYLTHPGGPKVLDAVARVFEVDRSALDLSRGVMRDFGNMSSATVLFILKRFLETADYSEGDLALMSAMGPGFSCEHVFLRC